MRKTNRFMISLIMTASLFVLCGGTPADDRVDETTLQCPNGMVSIGDNEYSVLEKCGEPAFEEERGTVWVYDYGPSEFVRYITFVDGKVNRIQFGGYGSFGTPPGGNIPGT